MIENNSQFDQQLLQEEQIPSSPPENPFDNKSFLQRILFYWIVPLVKKAQKRTLQQEDVFGLCDKDSSKTNYEKFNRVYEEMVQNPKVKNKIQATFNKIYKREIIIVIVLYSIQVLNTLLNAVFVSFLLSAFKSDERGLEFSPLIPGIVAMLFCYIFNSIIKSNYSFYYSQLTVRMTGALSMKIFEKVLKFPTYRNQFYKIGDILNMVQVDILQVVQYTQNYFSMISTLPLLILSVVVAFDSLNNISIIALQVATAVVFLIFSVILGRIYGQLQKKFMHEKDLRMRTLEEMMRGIKTIKYNSYEHYFDDRIKEKRTREVKQLYRQNFTQILNSFLNNLSNSVINTIITLTVGIDTFSQFIIIGNTFSIILGFIISLPSYIKGVVVGHNSLLRMNNFFSESFIYQLSLPEYVPDRSDQNYAIQLVNACFSWDASLKLEQIEKSIKLSKKERKSISRASTNAVFTMQSLNLSIQKGEFVVFLGELGSGKTSILQGILGEMEVFGGQAAFHEMVRINGDISVSTQEPWITQNTVKENIIYQQPYDEQRYRDSLNASCLVEDIAYFVDGDRTTIGENGDTLSGGQKKRVNLARAIYKTADIYLLDDPLSALDLHVAHHIVRECFNGVLKDKTRVLFVNSLLGMEKADRIFVVKNGQIAKEGTFREIQQLFSKSGDAVKKMEDQQINAEEDVEIRQQKRLMSNAPKSTDPSQNPQQSNFTKELIQKEDIQSGSINGKILMEFIRNIGGTIFVIGSILVVGLYIGANVYSRLMMLDVKSEDNPTEEEKAEQKRIILKYCLIDFTRSLAMFLQDNLLIFCMANLSRYLHQSIVFKLLRASFTKFYNLITCGRIMNRLSKDIYEIDTLIFFDMSQTFTNFGTIIVMIIMTCFCFSLRVLPIAIVYVIFSTFISIYFLRAKRQVVRIEATSKSPILQTLSEIIRGITYLRNCVQHESIRTQFRSVVDIDLQNQIVVNGVQYWFECIMNFMNLWPIMFSSIIVYYDLNVEGNDAIVIATSVANVALTSILLSQSWILFETHFVNYERCSRLNSGIVLEDGLDTLERQYPLINKSIPRNSKQSSRSSSSGIDDLESFQGSKSNTILFEDASFSYRFDQPNCLKKLHFSIGGKERIGIVGRTGAGKTSITLALTKVIDLISGDVLINGKSLKEFKLAELRHQVSVVSQEPYIFEGTLKDNLDPYQEHSEQELVKVFSECQFHAFKAFSKLGLESQISQLGDNLSEGEKQIVSIARILLKRSTIIIVDEPTSRVDEKTEELVTSMLNRFFSNCLLITIAHRIKTILESDKILVLDHGKVLEFDSPDNLLADKGTIFSGIIKAYNNKRIN